MSRGSTWWAIKDFSDFLVLRLFDNLRWPISLFCSWKTQTQNSRSGRLTEMSRKSLDLLFSASILILKTTIVWLSVTLEEREKERVHVCVWVCARAHAHATMAKVSSCSKYNVASKAKNSYYLALVLYRNFTKLWPLELSYLFTPAWTEVLLINSLIQVSCTSLKIMFLFFF